MTHQSQLGKMGEDLACRYLVNKNFNIIERNFRRPWGEIDVITKSSDKTLVFVEVKTMINHGEQGLIPEQQLSTVKLNKIKKTACLYAGYNQKLIGEKGWRIDLVAIQCASGMPANIFDNDLTEIEKHCEIRHYENVA